ncbi:MAG: ATP-binding cassette domain-containing protein [Pseudomonadota bacterium]
MQNSNQHLPLSVNNLTYRKNKSELIKDLNLEISETGSTIILGHNGAGKSLLLKLLHGVINPSMGSISWNHDTPNSNQYWRSFLLQKPTFFKRSARFNIEFVLEIAATPKSERKERCDEALKICGLDKISERSVHSFSGGELQKLSLARAWVLKPAVLLLDEPTVALDPPFTLSFEQIIQRFKKSHTKVIMTTHDLAQAKRLADEIVFLYNGKVLEQSPADVFFQQPKSLEAKKFISGQL